MYTTPILILAFNRPNHVKMLIDSLRPHQPQRILVGIDGPRQNSIQDKEKISRVLKEIKKIDWTSDIEIRIRKENLGLRVAVADAVSWAIKKHGEIIVVEDDVVVGPEFLTFMSDMLDKFRNDKSIGHISGYNLVPRAKIKNPEDKFRYSLIPESYAWATWERAWEFYEPSLSGANTLTLRKLRKLLGTIPAALVWKINFLDARKEAINTWAYRWVAALWLNNLKCVSPNRNLVEYTGMDDGTHTFLPFRQEQIKIESLRSLSADVSPTTTLNGEDLWIIRRIFHGTYPGLLFRMLSSLALRVRKLLPKN